MDHFLDLNIDVIKQFFTFGLLGCPSSTVASSIVQFKNINARAYLLVLAGDNCTMDLGTMHF